MRHRGRLLTALLWVFASWDGFAAPVSKRGAGFQVKPVPLPGAGPINLDYVAFDSKSHTLWVPAGNRGQVAVLDTQTLKLAAVDGFGTAQHGTRTVGPSSAAIGPGVVFVGNRADSKVCAVDAKTFKVNACLALESMPDGLAYVPSTREVWVTTPQDRSITVVSLSASGSLSVKAKVQVTGRPEGYAVDTQRGLFYTNLEDKDQTLVIDVKSRKIRTTLSPSCGKEGPRGLALDAHRHLLFVACTDGAVSFKDGEKVGRIRTGGGVDNIDYATDDRYLFIPSGSEGVLTVAQVGPTGTVSKIADVPTGEGCRGVTVDSAGNAYVTDPREGRLLMVRPVR